MFRILICGDRNWTDYFAIRNVLKEYNNQANSIGVECVIEGEASGADSYGRIAAEELGIKVLPFPAKWKEYGKAAGPIRNKQMIIEGQPNLILAFHDHIETSKGTKNMIEQAKLYNLSIRLYFHKLDYKILYISR